MTKNQIKAYFKLYGYECSYSGNERKMFVHGISSSELHHHALVTRGILLIPFKTSANRL